MSTSNGKREIVLDTETTGLSANDGDRVVEIGCIELFNHIPTGRQFHTHINPERDMPEGAFRVHGLSTEFLADKPLFHQVAEKFLDFISDATLVIHNAPFDMGFLNMELQRTGRSPLTNPVIDTVQLARQKHPGARVGLDALCKHYNIDNSHRTLHGALLDSEILAEVYLELIGGRQVALSLGEISTRSHSVEPGRRKNLSPRPNPAATLLDREAMQRHARLLEAFGNAPLWHLYEEQKG